LQKQKKQKWTAVHIRTEQDELEQKEQNEDYWDAINDGD